MKEEDSLFLVFLLSFTQQPLYQLSLPKLPTTFPSPLTNLISFYHPLQPTNLPIQPLPRYHVPISPCTKGSGQVNRYLEGSFFMGA